MAEAASAAGAAPLLPGLLDEIAIWEILVRLPPKSLLRCRAVCPAWRRATSTRHFLLFHHRRQPALPLHYGYNFVGDDIESLDIIPFNHQAGVAAADQLQSVARLAQPTPRLDACFLLEACCDGLLVLSVLHTPNFFICNPATRQFAHLPQLSGFTVLGMYPHPPTGEYRLLLYQASTDLVPDAQGGSYVYALGSGQPPRHIGCPDANKLIHSPVSLMFRGSLHWYASNLIMAFDTTAESFRQICSPVVHADAELFEMDSMLSMSSLNHERTIVDIRVMRDYQGEVWHFRYRVELPIAKISLQFGNLEYWDVVVTSWDDGHVLVQVKIDDWLLQVNIDGKLVSSVHRRGLGPTQHRLKQTLVRHTFFPTLEGYVVNASPFM